MEKLVRKQYLKRSMINHPNRSTGSKEAFQKLGNAKEFVNKYIEKQ
jgi:curved DNA-binding protein CbpA